MRKAYEGSLSVFFSLIFIVVVAFWVSLFSLSRYQIMKTGVRKDLDLAAFSTLAEYDQEWAREYGLYIMKEEKLEETIGFYLGKNASHGLWGYQMEELKVTPTATLAEPKALQDQILFFMKGRGILGLIEEAWQMASDIQNVQQNEEIAGWEDSETLAEIQALYGQLVTLVEGVREDGSKEIYWINGLLIENPSLSELLDAMRPEEFTSAQRGSVEGAYEEILQVQQLCDLAVELAKQLSELMEQLQNQEVLPFSSEDLKEYQKSWRDNSQICVSAASIIKEYLDITEWEGQIDESYYPLADQVESILSGYNRSITLPYEYKEGEFNDYSEVLDYLKGYSVDVRSLAPDVDLDFGNVQEKEAEENEVELNESFTNLVWLAEYALGVFGNFCETVERSEGIRPLNLRGETKNQHFLANEIEYLLVGKANEYKNVDGTRARLIAVRTVFNMLYLLTDAEKRATINALAAATGGILLPGIGKIIMFGVILSIWSLGEASLDYQVLSEGGKIPLWKDDNSWQSDIYSLLSFNIEGNKESDKGLNYEQYLRFLLYTVGQEELLNRIQNLLYLNHQKQDLSNMVTAFSIDGMVESMESEMSVTGAYGYAVYN